jgi:hypothetical protein
VLFTYSYASRDAGRDTSRDTSRNMGRNAGRDTGRVKREAVGEGRKGKMNRNVHTFELEQRDALARRRSKKNNRFKTSKEHATWKLCIRGIKATSRKWTRSSKKVPF